MLLDDTLIFSVTVHRTWWKMVSFFVLVSVEDDLLKGVVCARQEDEGENST